MSKIKLGISVEGQTEAFFVKYVLSRYLDKYNIIVESPVVMGGNISLDRVSNILSLIADHYDYVTTLYDFYGFQGKSEGDSCDSLERRILNHEYLKTKKNILPYVQKYEFEALLFSDIPTLCKHMYYSEDEIATCILQFNENIGDKAPEDINDSIVTAPSKRVKKIYKKYKKSIYGYIVAQDIGIAKIREKCPRFNNWLNKIIKLTENTKD